ncbi:MAG TPA: isoprenoid biosynthesis glyoxalase ElbB [Thermoanaerobaculales bacterium]|nr:isoprenoid biosynthesis glyoxalase ElbB [Thermoanaerobaculales bacterium]
MAKKVGVILSGCGVYDGAEVHEAVITMLALDRRGADMVLCAPDVAQLHVVNHLTGEVVDGESRNVLVESARIARGVIRDVAAVSADELDALILPGGYGAAKNLCDFALAGPDCTVNPDVARLVRAVHAHGKPVAAVCIAPALLAKVLGEHQPKLTIGNDPATAGALEKMGARHVGCPVDGLVVDRERKLVSTPAYMLATRISEAAAGIEKAVDALLAMA